MKSIASFALCFALLAPAGAQETAAPASAAQSRITFIYENRNGNPRRFSLAFGEDGAGNYRSEPGGQPAAVEDPREPVQARVQLSRPLVGAAFAAARRHHYFDLRCEDGKGRIAFQGNKTLSYQGADGQGSCTYNYSKTKSIQELGERLQAVSFTLEEGARLANKHQHDRLGLDAELETLAQEAAAGRALELANIAPVLQAIADDPQVIDRARNRARKLLPGGRQQSRAEGHLP